MTTAPEKKISVVKQISLWSRGPNSNMNPHKHTKSMVFSIRVCVVNTFQFVSVLCGCVNIWSSECRISLCWSRPMSLECFSISLQAEPRFSSYYLLLPSLWHCSAGLQFVRQRQVLSPPESRIACIFTTDWKFSIHTSHRIVEPLLIPAEALSCQILKRCCPEQLLVFNGIFFAGKTFKIREMRHWSILRQSGDWGESIQEVLLWKGNSASCAIENRRKNLMQSNPELGDS